MSNYITAKIRKDLSETFHIALYDLFVIEQEISAHPLHFMYASAHFDDFNANMKLSVKITNSSNNLVTVHVIYIIMSLNISNIFTDNSLWYKLYLTKTSA